MYYFTRKDATFAVYSGCQYLNRMRKGIRSIRKILVVVFLISLPFAAAYWAYGILYKSNFSPNETVYVFVDERLDFDELARQLKDSAKCMNLSTFKFLAKQLKYPSNMRTGRYAITSGSDNLEVLNMLRRGQQTAVRITFNNIRFLDDLAERLDDQLMLKKEDLLDLWENSSYCDSIGFTPETLRAFFIPNTYEVYWNVSAERFMQRMKREYDAFWNENYVAKAKAIGLTPVEVATLASIVEEETVALDEYPVVAGLYMNRLKKGMLLQADPTVKYAVGDFGLRRILYEHLEIDSPYNTYKYAGLPPAPLRVASVQGLESVLNYTHHNYLYMVAKEDFSGRHNFASTLEQHNRYAARYHAELNRRGIR